METLPRPDPSHILRRIALLLVHALVAGVLVSGFDIGSPSQVALAQAPEDSTPTSTVEPAPPPESPPEPPPEPPPPRWPAVPSGSGEGRRVVYSNGQQRVWLVDGGGVVDSWLVSGRAGVPAIGAYRVFSKSRHSSARGGRVRMEFMVRFARGRSLAIGFHSIPVTSRGRQPIQGEDELGHYRSAGCVRQRYADAATLWEFASMGTPVVVVESSKAKGSVAKKKCRRNCGRRTRRR